MLVISTRSLSFFFLFDLNFLISSLIYVTPLGFISRSPPPPLPLMAFIVSPFAPSYFSLSVSFCSSEVFRPSVFCFVCSLSGVHPVFAVAGPPVTAGCGRPSPHRHPPDTCPPPPTDFLVEPSQLSVLISKHRCEKTSPHAFFPATPQTLPRVLTCRFLAVQTMPHIFLEYDQ